MRLFFALRRGKGLSWLLVDESATVVPDTQKEIYGTLNEFCAAAGHATALISWDTEARITAIGRTSDLPDRRPIDISELFGPSVGYVRGADARALAARYFAADVGDLLPAGSSPSAEQWSVLYAFERGYNVICRAVAGAGKTTTLILCARRRPERKSLLLTYNKRLQLEVAAKAGPRTSVYTYHAAAGKAYGCVIKNDEAFRRFVRNSPGSPQRFDVLMLDEAQDMSVEYYVFVRYLLRANPGSQLIIVGDELQAINEYRGARPEFLTDAQVLYEGLTADRPWVSRKLTISHRLTPATAAFVNTHLYRAPVIIGGNARDRNVKPIYASCKNTGVMAAKLAAAVTRVVAMFGPGGVFVLAASVRNIATSSSPLAVLVRNHLAGVPTFVAGSDDAVIDADLIRGKLAILSFNASKGCERPCVVMIGLDELYFTYYDKTWTKRESLPNVITVAATRASALLIVMANTRFTIRTVDTNRLAADAEVRGGKPGRPRVWTNREPDRPQTVAVTELLRHQHPDTVRSALDRVLITAGPLLSSQHRGPSCVHKVCFGDFFESVSFAYGIAAPVLAEVSRTGETSFGEGLEAPTIVATKEQIRPYETDITMADYRSYPPRFWEQVTAAANTVCRNRTIVDWFRLAVARHAVWDGRHHIARQISHYDWVDENVVIAARDVILEALAAIPGHFEVPMPDFAAGHKTIKGRADFLEDGTGVVWEFKFADELSEDHTLQLACYLALKGGGDGILLSLVSRATRRVHVEAADAAPLLKLLVAKSYDAGVDIFDLIDRFDRTMLYDDVFDDGSSDNGPSVDGLSIDDMYG